MSEVNESLLALIQDLQLQVKELRIELAKRSTPSSSTSVQDIVYNKLRDQSLSKEQELADHLDKTVELILQAYGKK